MNVTNKKTFTVKHKLEDGNVVEGQFTTKRLSIKDRGRIGVKKSQLSGGFYCHRDDSGTPTGQGIDEETDALNAMIAHMEVCLIQAPTWWNLDEVADIGLVYEVYKEVLDFESSFFRTEDGKDNPGESRSVGEGNGDQQREGAQHGNLPTPVVDKKVQAALDA